MNRDTLRTAAGTAFFAPALLVAAPGVLAVGTFLAAKNVRKRLFR